jgi:hypothetical protein
MKRSAAEKDVSDAADHTPQVMAAEDRFYQHVPLPGSNWLPNRWILLLGSPGDKVRKENFRLASPAVRIMIAKSRRGDIIFFFIVLAANDGYKREHQARLEGIPRWHLNRSRICIPAFR